MCTLSLVEGWSGVGYHALATSVHWYSALHEELQLWFGVPTYGETMQRK